MASGHAYRTNRPNTWLLRLKAISRGVHKIGPSLAAIAKEVALEKTAAAHSDEVGRGFRAKPAACTD